jgi:hypothetical protein
MNKNHNDFSWSRILLEFLNYSSKKKSLPLIIITGYRDIVNSEVNRNDMKIRHYQEI